MFKRAALAVALMLAASVIYPSSVNAQTIPGTSIPTSVTQLVLSNATSQPVTIAVTVPAPGGANIEDGCTTSVTTLQMINVTPGQPNTAFPLTSYDASNVKGTFNIGAGLSYQLVNTLTNPHAVPPVASEQNCLQGLIISFAQLPTCPGTPPAFPAPGIPGPAIPNGVSAAEPTLNLPGTIGGTTGGGTNEACDITCVNGANSYIQITVSSPSSGALPWTYNSNQQIGPGQSLASQNSWVNVAQKCDNNCSPARPGVYPYGCTQCNRFPDPAPPCAQFCAAQNGLPPNNGCVFQRSPNTGNPITAQFGGSIVYTYLGPAHPPATCIGAQGPGAMDNACKKSLLFSIKPYKIKPIKPFKDLRIKAFKNKPIKPGKIHLKKTATWAGG